jgi:hypothetical protein
MRARCAFNGAGRRLATVLAVFFELELLRAVFDDLGNDLRYHRFTTEVIGIRFKPVELGGFHFGEFIRACADHTLELTKLTAGSRWVDSTVVRVRSFELTQEKGKGLHFAPISCGRHRSILPAAPTAFWFPSASTSSST